MDASEISIMTFALILQCYLKSEKAKLHNYKHAYVLDIN